MQEQASPCLHHMWMPVNTSSRYTRIELPHPQTHGDLPFGQGAHVEVETASGEVGLQGQAQQEAYG
jgi:hypothetical protein